MACASQEVEDGDSGQGFQGHRLSPLVALSTEHTVSTVREAHALFTMDPGWLWDPGHLWPGPCTSVPWSWELDLVAV